MESGAQDTLDSPEAPESSTGVVDPLPAAFSSFLGRETEISAVGTALEASRLVTLTGPPGIGKSRLALELADRPAGEARDGTAFVELAPIGDPALVPQAVAGVLRVQEVPGSTLTDALIAHLRDRSLLLVLDNCEHLLNACAELVNALLSGCPSLRILATSREPLWVRGETVWQVPALSVPNSGVEAVPHELLRYEAVALFVERAHAVNADWELIEEVAGSVAEIARRLDGIPLALELAATRIDSLTAAEIARRLDDRFALLTRGARSDLPRHQTLQAALDWSHDLLSSPDRALLRRLSVFVGGFCLEAAEEVCARGELERSEVFELLTGLVSKSLVASNTANSRGRYRMLETVRAYAADRLQEADEARALGEAHARFYLAFAEQAEPELTGPEQERWFDRLDSEHENLRFALRWSLGHGQTEWALRIAGAMILFWRVRCHFSEGRELLNGVVQASDGQERTSAPRATALWGAGFMALMAGDLEGAIPALEESLAFFGELEDRQGSARALLVLGNCWQYRDEPKARFLLEESADLAREAGDAWCLAHALGVAGFGYSARGELPTARPLFEECLAVAREAHEPQGVRMGALGLGWVVLCQGDYPLAESLLAEAATAAGKLGEDYAKGTALQHLGELALVRGDYGRARDLLNEALALMPKAGPPGAVVGPLILLGRVALAKGDSRIARLRFEQARAAVSGTPIAVLQGLGEVALEEGELGAGRGLLEEALEQARSSGHTGSTGEALHALGRLARIEGDVKRAAALLDEVLQLERRVGSQPGMVASLEAVAGLAAAAGRHQHAARLLGAAGAFREARGYARGSWESSRYEADLAALRERLSAEELETALAAGARLSLEEAVALASRGRGPRRRPSSGWPSVTATEQQVAALVAEGLTNPEIGARLFISRGTVKAHLSKIYSKLGVAGRRELAREVNRRQGRP